MRALLAGSAQVADAAAAQPSVVHVGAVMPAALAFRVRARLDERLRTARGNGAGGRSEQQEPELVAEAREQLVILALGVQLGFRLQRGADLACGAQRLDLLADR